MDLVSSCKDKLAYFRIKELKDVLTQLGLSKQGKKQDLVERILAILSDEQVNDRVYGLWAKKSATGKQEVARLVDDTYRKMQVSGASDLASKGQCMSDSSTVKPKEEIEDSYPKDKIRCLCGSSLQTDSMIKCEDPRCHVWQHIGCVIIPDKPVEGIPPAHPDIFYCEVCRLGRADPFWVTVAHPLYPVKLTTSNVPADGTNPVQSVEKSFQLTRADKDLLLKQEYDVQAWCMLLNDKVPFRMQWPQYADLQINGVPVRAINRPNSQLLGANGRDDGPIITPCTRDGINKILLTGCDSRMFCLGVRIVKRRSLQQILNMIPKESDGEKFDDALVRVCRCVGGGAAKENADSDSDLEIVSDSIPVNLRCPMSGSRMKVAGRFKPCPHMGCFDLEVFVEMNQRSRKWQCPICLKNYSLDNVIIDPYFNRITSKMRSCGEDITEIEVKPDGSWRAKVEGDRSSRDLGDLGLWHFPDGSLCLPPTAEGKVVKVKSEAALNTNVKQEDVSETHRSLRIGIRKNPNGCWEVSKQERLSSGNHRVDNKLENNHNIIPMSSSATGSGRDGEDASVNQDGCGNFDFSANNGIELDSISPQNIEQLYGFTNTNTSSLRDAEVIVLSDSDDENNIITPTVPPSSGPVMYNNHAADKGGVTFPLQTDSYPEYPVLGTGASSCLGGPFIANDDDFGMPLWPLPPGNQAGPSFQLFGSGSDAADVSDALVGFQHSSIGCPTSMNGYAESAMGSAALLPQSSVGRSNPNMNDDLVDNPLTFSRDDPSLQIFLPTRPDTSGMPNLRDQPDVSNSMRSDDWISLRLGDGGGSTSGQGHSASANGGVNLQQNNISKEEAQDSLAETASLLLGMNDNRSGKTNRELSDSPFSFPRQRRSVRPRLYLSIDSDSD